MFVMVIIHSKPIGVYNKGSVDNGGKQSEYQVISAPERNFVSKQIIQPGYSDICCGSPHEDQYQ